MSAEVLYKHGLQVDKDALGSPTTRAEQGLHPAGVPKRRKTNNERGQPPTPLPPRDPESHTLVNVHKDPKALPKHGSYKNHRPTEWYTRGGRCCACQNLAERLGYMEYSYDGEKDRKRVGTRCMPTTMPPEWTHVKGDAHVPERRTACLECSRRLKKPVWLCEECFGNRSIWDHQMAKPAAHRMDVG